MEIFLETLPISKRIKTSLSDYGIMTINELKTLSLDELKSIPGLGPNSLKELREYIYIAYKFVFKPKPKEKKKTLQKFEDSKLVVAHFLHNVPNINWALQLKNADALLKEYSLNFLLSVDPPKNIYSLGYFFQDFGKKYLNSKMPAKIIKEEPVVKEIEEPGIEYVANDHTKPRNLKDFLGI